MITLAGIKLVVNPEYGPALWSVPLKKETSIACGPVARNLDESNAGFTDAQNCSLNNRNDPHQRYDLHQSHENIRVECREPLQGRYYSEQNDTYAPLCTHEIPHNN